MSGGKDIDLQHKNEMWEGYGLQLHVNEMRERDKE